MKKLKLGFTDTHDHLLQFFYNLLANRFDIEIVDTVRNLKYYQRFTENMFKKEEPVITQIPKKSCKS
jgi:hypothetical protein